MRVKERSGRPAEMLLSVGVQELCKSYVQRKKDLFEDPAQVNHCPV